MIAALEAEVKYMALEAMNRYLPKKALGKISTQNLLTWKRKKCEIRG